MLFHSRDFVVIDKPAGLAVHPGPRTTRSVEDFFPALSRRRDGPWLAHRLDAGTAGCLLIALRRAALHAAQAEFAAGRVRKTYWAIVHGRPPTPTGTTHARLAKQTTPAGWRMAVRDDGQPATTDWHTLGTAGALTWLELHPATGRTHQIRIHCAALGCPLLGDPIYGDGVGPLQLLARALALDLPEPVKAIAEPPAPMRALLAGML